MSSPDHVPNLTQYQMTLKRLIHLLLHLSLVALVTASAPPRPHGDVTDVRDWAIPQGHFYTQTNGSAAE